MRSIYCVGLLFLCLGGTWGNSFAKTKKVVGWIEPVTITEKQLALTAKIDSGADQSSLHAIEPHLVMRKGVRWVRFRIVQESGKELLLERELVGTVNIKKKGGGVQKRYVVNMKVCLGGLLRSETVNLSNRTHFKQRMLIGRNYLKKEFLIDTGETFLSRPRCQ